MATRIKIIKKVRNVLIEFKDPRTALVGPHSRKDRLIRRWFAALQVLIYCTTERSLGPNPIHSLPVPTRFKVLFTGGQWPCIIWSRTSGPAGIVRPGHRLFVFLPPPNTPT